jgi:replicative DNA helicase
LQVAASCGCPALYVTAEMAPLELLRRITARITNTYLGKFKTGELHPKEAARLVRQAAKAAPDMAIMDATQGYASPADILSAAEATRTLAPTGHLLIVVDSVHSWAEGAPGGEEYDRLNAHLAALRKLAARLSCPILTVAERNRANSSGGLSAAAGSRKFEYGGESVFDLASKEDSTDDANGERPITLKLAKNRHGTPGKRIELRFHGALQSFREA